MPSEYVLNGWSRKSAELGELGDVLGRGRDLARARGPMEASAARMFSTPVNSGCSPPPISSSAWTSPCTSTVALGRREVAA